MNNDKEVELMWKSFGVIKLSELPDGSFHINKGWHIFQAGTDRDDIFDWFDKMHTKGIDHLLLHYPTDFEYEDNWPASFFTHISLEEGL